MANLLLLDNHGGGEPGPSGGSRLLLLGVGRVTMAALLIIFLLPRLVF